MFWLHSRNPLPSLRLAWWILVAHPQWPWTSMCSAMRQSEGGGNFFWKLIPDWRKGAGHGLESWWANFSLLERSDVWSLRREGRLAVVLAEVQQKKSCGWDVGPIKGLVESRKCTFCVLHGTSWRLMIQGVRTRRRKAHPEEPGNWSTLAIVILRFSESKIRRCSDPRQVKSDAVLQLRAWVGQLKWQIPLLNAISRGKWLDTWKRP